MHIPRTSEILTFARDSRLSSVWVYNNVFIRKTYHIPEQKKHDKLSPKAHGPFKVISVYHNASVVEMGNSYERNFHYRVGLAHLRSSEVILNSDTPIYTASATPETYVNTWSAILHSSSRGCSDLPTLSDTPAEPDDSRRSRTTVTPTPTTTAE